MSLCRAEISSLAGSKTHGRAVETFQVSGKSFELGYLRQRICSMSIINQLNEAGGLPFSPVFCSESLMLFPIFS
jgi:hypothetical protein